MDGRKPDGTQDSIAGSGARGDGLASTLPRGTGWASRLEMDLTWIRDGDLHGVTHFLSAQGGPGSLTDLVLHPMNGHDLAIADVPAVNQALSALTARAWDLA